MAHATSKNISACACTPSNQPNGWQHELSVSPKFHILVSQDLGLRLYFFLAEHDDLEQALLCRKSQYSRHISCSGGINLVKYFFANWISNEHTFLFCKSYSHFKGNFRGQVFGLMTYNFVSLMVKCCPFYALDLSPLWVGDLLGPHVKQAKSHLFFFPFQVTRWLLGTQVFFHLPHWLGFKRAK